jgi:hypothetical protein
MRAHAPRRAGWVCLAGAVAWGSIGCSDLPTGPAEASFTSVRGMSFADWTPDGYGKPQALAEVDLIAATGANTMVIIVTAYQRDREADEIREDPQKTPTDVSVTSAITRWKPPGGAQADRKVCIKPHIDLDDGEWRGKISPRNPSAWFESYRQFLIAWATLAGILEVDQFVVGTELAGTLKHEGMWRGLIGEVREVFSGELIYAASWDEAPLVPFWKKLDLVGVNFYAPVAVREQTSRIDLLAGWQRWLDRLRLLHKQTGRDILLTEIGYRSVDGAGMHPYDFVSQPGLDPEEQADLYWTALQAIGDKRWIRGLYWWNWLANGSGGPQNGDYTPKGKPAEKELIDAWRM